MNNAQYALLNAMDITVWQLRNKESEKKLSPPDWESLEQRAKACSACLLHQSRKKVVFGVGNKRASLLFIGEAPGAQEDAQGEPFVGRAGSLLNNMLQSMGLCREEVYVANIIKCRPPNNRNPEPEEIKQCTPFLQQQIDFLQPKLIVALGRIAAHHLLNTEKTMRELRGKLFKYGARNTPLIATYHPAYLLRSPKEKQKAFQDLCFIQQQL